jgi:hypothetical protein
MSGPYIDEMMRNSQCGFQPNISHIFSLQIPVKKNGSVMREYITEFKKTGYQRNWIVYDALYKFGRRWYRGGGGDYNEVIKYVYPRQ